MACLLHSITLSDWLFRLAERFEEITRDLIGPPGPPGEGKPGRPGPPGEQGIPGTRQTTVLHVVGKQRLANASTSTPLVLHAVFTLFVR